MPPRAHSHAREGSLGPPRDARPRVSAVEANLLFIPSDRATGASNMALDESLLGLGAVGRVAIRFYGWEPPCLSLGRNQPTGDTVAGRRRSEYELGVDIVRRPTAGRSVYHGPELTYAVVAPDRLWSGPRAIYRRIHAVLSAALFSFGVHTDRSSEPEETEARSVELEVRPGPPAGDIVIDARECFVATAPGEITVGGRKLVGSAQWRHAGAVLQHGSILLRDEQGKAVLDGGAATGAAIGLAEILGETPDLELLGDAVAAALAGELGVPLEPGPPPDEVLERASKLEDKYRSPEWTWRR